MIAQASGGTISVTGEEDGQPVKPGLSLGDTGTGMTMAITILGALRKRRETGEGCRLQVAMQDAMLHYMRTNFSTQARTGKAVERDGSSFRRRHQRADRACIPARRAARTTTSGS